MFGARRGCGVRGVGPQDAACHQPRVTHHLLASASKVVWSAQSLKASPTLLLLSYSSTFLLLILLRSCETGRQRQGRATHEPFRMTCIETSSNVSADR